MTDTFMCGMPPASGPKLQARDFLRQFTWCCIDAAERGAKYCTCWEPEYDLEQQRLDPNARTEPRPYSCGDCAFRPGSPELKADPYGLIEVDEFYCHKGIRRPIRWRHPDGRVRDGYPGDYQPMVLKGVPYRADGTPAAMCARGKVPPGQQKSFMPAAHP